MRVRVLQHVPFEGPARVAEWAAARGHALEATRLFAGEPLPDPAALDLLVVLGGPMSVADEDRYPWLRPEKRFLRAAVASGAPVLGICLGAQLLARALGAEVRTAEAPEIGWLPIAPTAKAAGDPLFGHLTAPAGVYQWHHDVFELPAGARLLATSERFENQAFRAGNAWGVQFHPEVDPETFEVWIGNHPGAAAANGIDEEALRETVWREAEASRPFRARLFDAFFELVAG